MRYIGEEQKGSFLATSDRASSSGSSGRETVIGQRRVRVSLVLEREDVGRPLSRRMARTSEVSPLFTASQRAFGPRFKGTIPLLW